MDKSKFTVNPHLDSEGFVDLRAACRGCGPNEACPRSGYCERYASPLRYPPTPWEMLSDETLDRVYAIWCGQSARILTALGEIMRANQPRRRAR